MRTIYSPAGADVTSAVQAALQANRTFYMCNLYTFINRMFWKTNAQGVFAYWGFSDFDTPLNLTQLQLFSGQGAVNPTTLNGGGISYYVPPGYSTGTVTYLPENIERAKLTYSIGFEADNVDITWFLDDNIDYFSYFGAYSTPITPATPLLSIKQTMATYRAFDDCPFWIHRGIFSPTIPITEGSLIGAFTDGTGQLVAAPFLIGTGLQIIVPTGATQLQMGISDYPINDNTGSFIMQVNGTNVTVGATHQPWQFTGGINSAYPYTYDSGVGALGPVVVSGLTAGQNVVISWVSGYINLHGGTSYFGPNGSGQPLAVNTSGLWATSTVQAKDPYLVGTTLMYRGFIRETEATPEYLKIKLGSLMQIIQDLQVPTQLIMPGNRDVQFLPSPSVSGSILVSPITVVAPNVIQFVANATITQNQYQDCWMNFQPTVANAKWAPQNGLPPVSIPGWKIQSNTAGSSGATITVIFYDAPIIPSSPSAINIYSQTEGVVPGFPHIPPPEVSL